MLDANVKTEALAQTAQPCLHLTLVSGGQHDPQLHRTETAKIN